MNHLKYAIVSYMFGIGIIGLNIMVHNNVSWIGYMAGSTMLGMGVFDTWQWIKTKKQNTAKRGKKQSSFKIRVAIS